MQLFDIKKTIHLYDFSLLYTKNHGKILGVPSNTRVYLKFSKKELQNFIELVTDAFRGTLRTTEGIPFITTWDNVDSKAVSTSAVSSEFQFKVEKNKGVLVIVSLFKDGVLLGSTQLLRRDWISFCHAL